jgi:hypothetical protein
MVIGHFEILSEKAARPFQNILLSRHSYILIVDT